MAWISRFRHSACRIVVPLTLVFAAFPLSAEPEGESAVPGVRLRCIENESTPCTQEGVDLVWGMGVDDVERALGLECDRAEIDMDGSGICVVGDARSASAQPDWHADFGPGVVGIETNIQFWRGRLYGFAVVIHPSLHEALGSIWHERLGEPMANDWGLASTGATASADQAITRWQKDGTLVYLIKRGHGGRVHEGATGAHYEPMGPDGG